jgi:hypothetical protein
VVVLGVWWVVPTVVVSECRRERVLGTRWFELHETRAMLNVCNKRPAVVASFPETGVLGLPFTCQTRRSRTTGASDVSFKQATGG